MSEITSQVIYFPVTCDVNHFPSNLYLAKICYNEPLFFQQLLSPYEVLGLHYKYYIYRMSSRIMVPFSGGH